MLKVGHTYILTIKGPDSAVVGEANIPVFGDDAETWTDQIPEIAQVLRAMADVTDHVGAPLHLPDWVRPGASFRLNFGPGNHNTGRRLHVRGLVDDRVVLREWSRDKRAWRYTVEDAIYFEIMVRHIDQIRGK